MSPATSCSRSLHVQLISSTLRAMNLVDLSRVMKTESKSSGGENQEIINCSAAHQGGGNSATRMVPEALQTHANVLGQRH